MYRSINVDFMYERNKIENCVENIKMKNRTFQSKSQVSIPASHSDCNRDINFRNKYNDERIHSTELSLTLANMS